MAGALVIKQIKPSRFKDEAFRQAIYDQANAVADEMLKDFKATTATWEHEVAFEKIVSLKPSPVEVLVGTDDEIYTYVNEGTRPHVILPKKAKALAFPSGYVAKTKPRVIGSQAGGSYGPNVFAAGVLHPGTKAREFDAVIEKKWAKQFRKDMEKAMVQAAQASGHAI